MTTINITKLLAKKWGLDPESEEFKNRRKEMRKRFKENGGAVMVPALEPCPVCGDNSYDCGCD